MIAFMLAHVWQSTLFAAGAALLAWLLRTNQARLRHLLWLTASVKFLVPFAALVAIGRELSVVPGLIGLSGLTTRAVEALPAPAVALIETAAQPFDLSDLSKAAEAATPVNAGVTIDTPEIAVAIWIAGVVLIGSVWLFRWRKVRSILWDAEPLAAGREAEILRQVARRSGIAPPPLLACRGSLEPGVVGFLKPVILWPSAIGDRMDDDQIAAILLHEVSHIKRHDNLLAAIHMAVNATFWFHPVVWWIGVRLVDERERACDEAVVRLGADPHKYAESILHTCEYAVESPLACVAGVTGADLKRRIGAIVSGRRAGPLGILKLALLIILALMVTGGPIVAGALIGTAPVADAFVAVIPDRALTTSVTGAGRRVEMRRFVLAQGRDGAAATPAGLKFEVASIKRLRPSGDSVAAAVRLGGQGNYFRHTGSIRVLIQQAYQMPFVRQIGGPSWISEDNYAINAKIPDGVARTPEATRLMLRALLEERFKLVVREEDQELPVYVLVHARADKTIGPRLQPFTRECPAGTDDPECRSRMMAGRGVFQMRNAPFERFASLLESPASGSRPVVDRTGITGRYNIDVVFAPDDVVAAGASDLPSLFTALQEQLGLKLEPERLRMPVVVIQSIERPTED